MSQRLTEDHPLAYRYRIKDTGKDSKWFGACNVCQGHCTATHIQTEETQVYGSGRLRWLTTADWFGHRACLEAQQKATPTQDDDSRHGQLSMNI